MSQCFQKKAFIYNHLKAMNKREKSNIQKYVSLKVKEFRESAGLTQEQFAERLNSSAGREWAKEILFPIERIQIVTNPSVLNF